MNRIFLLSAVIVAALLLAACSDDDPVPTVTVAGTITFAGWLTGDSVVAIFPQGTAADDTGELGFQDVAGDISSATAYSVPVPANSGNVYAFGFNDASGDDGPTGEAGACSAVFAVAAANITGIDLTFTVAGPCFTSP